MSIFHDLKPGHRTVVCGLFLWALNEAQSHLHVTRGGTAALVVDSVPREGCYIARINMKIKYIVFAECMKSESGQEDWWLTTTKTVTILSDTTAGC